MRPKPSSNAVSKRQRRKLQDSDLPPLPSPEELAKNRQALLNLANDILNAVPSGTTLARQSVDEPASCELLPGDTAGDR